MTVRLIPIIAGCLVALPALGLLAAGGGLGAAQLFERDGDGYFEISIDRLDSTTPAVMANDLSFASHPGTPGWIVNSLQADVRLRVTGAEGSKETFVGIARNEDLDSYLAGVAHARVTDLVDGKAPVYQVEDGIDEISAPVDQEFWAATASGEGPQELQWRATEGNWSVVVMNADGSPGVAAGVAAGLRVASLSRLIVLVLVVGLAMAAASVALIVTGTSRSGIGLRA